MKTTLLLRTAILIAFVTVFGSCYFSPENGGSATVVTVNNQSQAVIGGAGDGIYLRARIYDASQVDTMIADGTIENPSILAGPGNIYYTQSALLPPLGTDVFFINSDPWAGGLGIVVLVDLMPARKFRLLLEQVLVESGSILFDPNAAVVTDSFEVPAGGNITLELEMLSYQYS